MEESGIKVLVVDDKKENLTAMAAILESPSYKIIKAESGEEALRYLLSNDVALILLDVQMPTLDGFETARAIKQRQKLRDIPIIFVTAVNREEKYITAGYGAGAVDYIFKPIDSQILKSKVNVFIDLFKSQEALRAAHDQLEHKVFERTKDLEIARAEAEAARMRAAFLAEASRTFSESFNFEDTIQNLIDFMVPRFADWCTVDVVNERQELVQVGVFHRQPEKTKLLQQIRETYPPNPGFPHGSVLVFQTGKSEFRPDVDENFLLDLGQNAEHLGLLQKIGVRSFLCIPMIARSRTLGVTTLAIGDSTRRYHQSDLAMAEDLISRAAITVDNARLYKEAQEANRIKDEFLATVSHELRTPLTSILGWARMLRSGKIGDEATSIRALEAIERNAKSQSQLIDDLLDVSRIITGKFLMDVLPVDLKRVLENALDSIGPLAEEKHLEFQSKVDPNIAPVSGDPTRLQQVFWNLLSNAVKFTENGGCITVSMEPVSCFVQISVTDTGKGINPDFLPHVFERFRQADSTTTRTHGGLGLGLAIVRHIVEQNGGSISVDSKGEGHGTTFTVLLPMMSLEERARFKHPEVRKGETPDIQGVKILLIDDNQDTREMLLFTLQEKNAEVRSTDSPAEALDIVSSWRPDILVSDIAMPGEDGYLLIEKVRRYERLQNRFTPAIALTAYAGIEDRKKALSSGFQSHIAKPVDTAELILMISSLTNRTFH